MQSKYRMLTCRNHQTWFPNCELIRLTSTLNIQFTFAWRFKPWAVERQHRTKMLGSSSFTATPADKLWFIVHTEAPGDRCTSWYLSGLQCEPGTSPAAWQSGEKRGTPALPTSPWRTKPRVSGCLGTRLLSPSFPSFYANRAQTPKDAPRITETCTKWSWEETPWWRNVMGKTGKGWPVTRSE